MTDLEGFALRAGRAARKVRDDDLAYGRDPVWMQPDDAWSEWSNAILRAPNDELKAFFMSGWDDPYGN